MKPTIRRRRPLEGPVILATANLDFATGAPADHDHLRHLISGSFPPLPRGYRDLPLVLCLQEAKNVRLRRLLPKTFHVRQGRGEARSGTAIASRGVRLRNLHLWLAGDSTETLPRWVTDGVLPFPNRKRLVVFAVHVYPARAGRAAQAAYVAALRRRTDRVTRAGHAWAVGCDANMDLHDLARLLGGVPYQRGIVGFVTSPNVSVRFSGLNKYGLTHQETDHPAGWIVVDGIR